MDSSTSGTSGGSRTVAGLELHDALRLLSSGKLEVIGRLTDASNATLYCTVSLDGLEAACVHKPVAGERPLWDFPQGTLANREVAAYAVSEATGWGIIPPTVLREGPFGPGMCQLWIETDPDAEELVGVQRGHRPQSGWLRVLDAQDNRGRPVVVVHRDDERLRRIAVLDVIINNADRKGGHLLVAADAQVYGIDHGVSFAVEDKLRTLLWGWSGQGLSSEAGDVLARLSADLHGSLAAQLADVLAPDEIAAVRTRVARLRAGSRHPEPSAGWPAVPWPLF